MGDQVQLSAYSEAIQNLIRCERYDEAIAVCHHILFYYPKNISTYRQMAEANLEKGNLQDAAELFRRVLSADPEDDIAYTGLAIIFERQALIDEAVWHLERAYELRPGNLEIRDELLRLYGERDGRPHARLKLTPGALGRLYVREGLFHHAVQEFRSILSDTPRRLDARMALAESLWHAGQVREATEISQELLQTLPYCLKANLILGMVSQESGGGEAETYWHTAEALDPTNRAAHELLGDQSPLQMAQVLVPKFVEGATPAAPEIETEEQAAQVAPWEEPAKEQAPSAGEGFEEWFGEGSLDAELTATPAPSETDFEVQTGEEPATPFEELPAQDQVAQGTTTQEESAPMTWATEMGLPADLAEAPSAEQSLAAEPSPEVPLPPPTSEPELPGWLLGDFGAASSPAEATAPFTSSLPPWLAEFQKTHQADMPAEPATVEEESAAPYEPGLEASAESIEMEEMPPSPATAEQEPSLGEPLPSWITIPPSSLEAEGGLTQELFRETPEDIEAAQPEAAAPPAPVEPSVPSVQAPPAAVEDETLAQFEEWFEETRAHVAAEAAKPSTTERKRREEPPDWLKGLEVLAAPEPPVRKGEEQQAPEAESQPAPPLGVEGELPVVTAPLVQAPQETVASSQTPSEDVSLESDILTTEARIEPTEVESLEAEPIESEPPGEAGTVTLFEEAVDRELYGEPTSELETLEISEEQAAEETEPEQAVPGAPPTEIAREPEELRAAEMVRSRRDPKGYAHLLRARTHSRDNRLGEALKEYDYLVQHSPRLVSAVIEDLEELIRELDVPLEAHRILGDAYTRADRLAQALECYRFVLQRVS